MKKFIILFCIMPMIAIAAEAPKALISSPTTSCPAGYTRVFETFIGIANSSCATGYTSVGTAYSCLASTPAGSCMMYAPTDITYSDASGTYTYTSTCPLI